VNRLRNRLILIFLAATLAPLAATIWVTISFLELSLEYSSTDKLDAVSKSMEAVGLEFYKGERTKLKQRAEAGELEPHKYTPAERAAWPEAVKTFAEGDQDEAFTLSGDEGNRLDYLTRRGGEIWVFSASLGDVRMERLHNQFQEARAQVNKARQYDFRRGFKLGYLFLATLFWLVSLALLVYLAHRISRPVQQLTAGLGELAAGNLSARVRTGRDDEIGRAIHAFNHMAERLQESTDRLVYLGQLASWQTLARKMAHELKNSLTPIRLTVEEMAARCDEADRGFMEQATQIVVD